MRNLLRTIECHSLTVADVKSLDFTVMRFLMKLKLFKSANMEIINDRLLHFKFSNENDVIACCHNLLWQFGNDFT